MRVRKKGEIVKPRIFPFLLYGIKYYYYSQDLSINVGFPFLSVSPFPLFYSWQRQARNIKLCILEMFASFRVAAIFYLYF